MPFSSTTEELNTIQERGAIHLLRFMVFVYSKEQKAHYMTNCGTSLLKD
jgi:hypothetical protein